MSLKYLKFNEVYKILSEATKQKLLLVNEYKQEIVTFEEVTENKHFYLVSAVDKTRISWNFFTEFKFSLNGNAIYLQNFYNVVKIKIYSCIKEQALLDSLEFSKEIN